MKRLLNDAREYLDRYVWRRTTGTAPAIVRESRSVFREIGRVKQ
jgi:hypothetical protein